MSGTGRHKQLKGEEEVGKERENKSTPIEGRQGHVAILKPSMGSVHFFKLFSDAKSVPQCAHGLE